MAKAAWLWPAVLCLRFAAAEPAARRIYIAPDDHTDYLWTAGEETYRQAFLQMLDYYLDLADATEGRRPEHQSRWNCDGSLWMWTYEHNRSPEAFARFIRRVRDGHITVPLNVAASCYGAAPAEAVLRGMYYAGHIERRYRLRFPLAIAMEDQTLPYGLGALWAGAGARFSWRGVCGCATELKKTIAGPRPHEVYWWEGPDGSRVLMKWDRLYGDNKSIGGYAEAYDPAAAIHFVEGNNEFAAAYPYPIIGIFGKGWDDLKTLTDEFVRVAAELTNARRTVIVSNEIDYFCDLEAAFGPKLPVYSASFGNEWDVYSASMAEVSARVRRAVEKLRAAEALAAVVELKRPHLLRPRDDERDRAWMALGLYWEHDWTADSPVLPRKARAEWQRARAADITSYVDRLAEDAATALGTLIPNPGPAARYFVFNPLSWARSGIADLVDAPAGQAHVVDVTNGEEVPSQIVGSGSARRMRILAPAVPPLGYKVFEVRPGTGRTFPPAARAKGALLENDRYRIELNGRGAIVRLISKELGGRDLAARIDGRWINDLGPAAGRIRIENAGPVSVTLAAESGSPAAHVSRITLVRDAPGIEIRNEITRNFSRVLTWAFSFDLRPPDVWHEEVGAIVHARLLGDGGQYAPQLSRLDWLTLNHFVAMNGADGAGVTLANADCAFMKLGRSAVVDGVSRLDTTTPQLSVLAGGQVDGPKLGIPDQGGDSRFLQRFALSVHRRFDPAGSMRFALEFQNPLVAGRVGGGEGLPERSFSLVNIDNAKVLLWALEPAEEGIDHGVIARLWNLSPEPQRFALRLTGCIGRARAVTHLETDLESAAVVRDALAGSAAPWQLRTYRLELK